MRQSFQVKKMAELEVLLPGFKALWPSLKAVCGSSQRCPKSVTFTDEPQALHLNDGECGKRFALDLATMELGPGQHVSSGEWAVHAGSNHDAPVVGVPSTHAVLVCVWHDYYRSFSVTVQVKELPKQLKAG